MWRAVSASLKSGGVPEVLSALLEGESLFNDASGLVLFDIFFRMLVNLQRKDDQSRASSSLSSPWGRPLPQGWWGAQAQAGGTFPAAPSSSLSGDGSVAAGEGGLGARVARALMAWAPQLLAAGAGAAMGEGGVADGAWGAVHHPPPSLHHHPPPAPPPPHHRTVLDEVRP